VKDGTRGRAWRLGEYFGLVTDKPKPKIGNRVWWLQLVFVAACIAVGLVVLNAVRQLTGMRAGPTDRLCGLLAGREREQGGSWWCRSR